MHCLGMPRGRAFQGSVDYLEKNLEWVCEGHGSPCLNMLHGALACHRLGRDVWLRFRRKFETRIIAAQDDEGCLSCICENKAFGVTCDSKSPFANVGFLRDGRRTYTTALHTFVLLLDRGNLQIIKRRKPGPATTPRRK